MDLHIRINDSRKAFYLLQEYLGLSTLEPVELILEQAPIFISIDLEYNEKCVTQLGISTFDPQSFNSPNIWRSISNEYPISSALYSTKVSRHVERRRKPSHFGEKHVLVSKDLQTLLTEILSPKDEQGKTRDVWVVGHMVIADLEIIKQFCDLDICRDIPSVKAILDTQQISRCILNPDKPISLKNLMIALELDTSAFTMRHMTHDILYEHFCLCFAKQLGKNHLPRKHQERMLSIVWFFWKILRDSINDVKE